jgi:O-antigen/teichoic acid export membrane protein
MLGRFLRHSALYSLSAVMSRGVGIVLVPIYTRAIQAAEIGALDLLTMAAMLCNHLLALEISQGIARCYADAEDAQARDRYISSAWWFAALMYCAFLALAWPLAGGIAELLLGSAEWRPAVQAMALAFCLNGMFFLMQDLARWQLRPVQFAVTSFAYTLVGTAVGLYLLLAWDAGVPGLLYGQCAGAVVGIAFAWRGGAGQHWHLAFSRAAWSEMVRYSGPQAVSAVAAFATLYADRLVISRLLSLEDVGAYGIAARIASVVTLLMAGFQSGLVPIVFQRYRSSDTPGQLARALDYFVAAAIALVLFLAAFSRELLWVFATPAYYATWPVIPVLASALLVANAYIFVPGLFLARRTLIVAGINIVAGTLTVAGSVALIPVFGAIGAAGATLVASTVLFAAYVYYNQRFYPIALDRAKFAVALAAGLGAALALTALQRAGALGALAVPRLVLWMAASLGCAWLVLGAAECGMAARRLIGIISRGGH